ncbi:MAG: hypothetical protein A2W26_10230 [Acidobacteria bacterium RBG_16_64_8]|nr:MAG: hypothetical protein A2W26_10230 [Acidobacteria bacterium RBG_16_64_8]
MQEGPGYFQLGAFYFEPARRTRDLGAQVRRQESSARTCQLSNPAALERRYISIIRRLVAPLDSRCYDGSAPSERPRAEKPRRLDPEELAVSRSRILHLLAPCFGLLFCHANAHAQWTANGVALTSGLDFQRNPHVLADGTGGAFFVWEDGQSGSIRLQRLSAGGSVAPGWPVGALDLGLGEDPVVASDDSGGVITAWKQYGSIAVQRVTREGKIAPGWPGGGVGVLGPSSTNDFRLDPQEPARPQHLLAIFQNLLPDGAHGALLAWELNDRAYDRVHDSHVDARGSVEWTNYSVGGCQIDQIAPVIAPDGSGGVLLVWIGNAYHIESQRTSATGGIAPEWQDSCLVLCSGFVHRHALGIVSDGASGAIVFWEDRRNNAYDQIYAQHFKADRTLVEGWPDDGRLVCSFPTAPGIYREVGLYRFGYSSVVSDGSGGALIAWTDARSDTGDIYCQRILGDGSVAPGWTADGVPICRQPGLQDLPTIASDGSGGALITWEDARAGSRDVYVQRVSATGAIADGWPENGLAVCTADGDQVTPRIASDGFGGAVIAWTDGRNGSRDIYAAKVAGNGIVPTRLALVSAQAEPGRVRLSWFSSKGPGAAGTVYRRQEYEEWAAIGATIADGSGLLTYEDSDVVAGGRYGYRLDLGDDIGGDVWIDVPSAFALRLDGMRPNPGVGEARIAFSLASSKPAVLEIFNARGQRVWRRDVGVLGAGNHVVNLGDIELARGIYLVRLTQGLRSVTVKVAWVRGP